MPDASGHLTTGSVFDDLGRAPDEVASLKIRAALLGRVTALVRERGLSTSEAASTFGVDEARAVEVFEGRLSRFTIDDLVGMLARAGVDVSAPFEAV